MAVRDGVIVVRSVLTQLYHNIFNSGSSKQTRFARAFLLVASLGAVSVGGFYLYKIYVENREAAASRIFDECMNEVKKVQDGYGSWRDVQLAFQSGYDRSSSSRLAPYFLAQKADASYNMGQKDEAIKSLSQALGLMSESSDLYSVYKVKLALMKIDMSDANLSSQGIDELESLAQPKGKSEDKDLLGKSLALYYLGLYYWDKADFTKVKVYWNDLVKINLDGQELASEYAKIAREKLKQIS